MDFAAIGKIFTSYDSKAPMLFNSGAFFFLFIFFLLIYSMVYKVKMARTIYVIAFSLFFYYKASGWYLLLLVGSAVADYLFAIMVSRSKEEWLRKLWLVVSIVFSLGLLAYFKYTNFFVINWNAITGSNFSISEIFLPIGISFYTFQSLSYIIDVYWKKIDVTNNFGDYLFFLTFFPHLVAGPIVKAKLFLPQLKEEVIIKREEVYMGLYLIICGLLKKSVLADYVSQYSDLVFADPGHYSGFENLMAAYCYALQIYCDFSGYSDMAIGLAKIMGFNLGVNFNFPYQAQSITDFWRRWHIALSTWLRDYLYIPLGGNKKGRIRTYINSFITMLLGGLWHGASWKFVFWGGMHGVGLAVHKLFDHKFGNIKIEKNWQKSILKILAWALTFHFVIFLWIFFRAKDFSVAWSMVHQIVFNMDLAFVSPFFSARKLLIIILIFGIITHAVSSETNQRLMKQFVGIPFWAKLAIFVVSVQLAIQFTNESVQPFIYFQF